MKQSRGATYSHSTNRSTALSIIALSALRYTCTHRDKGSRGQDRGGMLGAPKEKLKTADGKGRESLKFNTDHIYEV